MTVARLAPFGFVLLAVAGSARGENVDPAHDGSQYVWGENVGWINAEPSGDGGPGMQVNDFELSGWLWGENTGWISLSCSDTAGCDTIDYRVRNDGGGVLSGLAFGENLGWIDFAPTTGGGVFIDPSTGEFTGEAWSENAGWIVFESNGVHAFSLITSWTCDPSPAPPALPPSLTTQKSGNDLVLQWGPVAGATGFDVVSGSLAALRSSGGDFAVATGGCASDNDTDSAHRSIGALLDPGDVWYLVRPLNCGGAGSYDSGGAGQAAPRDAAIASSGTGCP